MPPTTYESATAGPAYPAAASPVRTKSPVPMITPIPNRVRSNGPSVLRNWNSGSSVSRIDCSMDLVRMIPIFLPFQVLCTISRPTIRGHSTSFAFLVLYRATCTGRGRPSRLVVLRSQGDFGAVVGVRPGDGAEGRPLLWGTEDADRVAGSEHQVRPGVRDHLIPPHDGQDRHPGLAPNPKVPYRASKRSTPSEDFALVSLRDASLGQPYPLHFDRLRGLPQPCEEAVALLCGPLPGYGSVQLAPYAVGEVLGLLSRDPEARESLARQLQAGL